jgi:hypothetical protein
MGLRNHKYDCKVTKFVIFMHCIRHYKKVGKKYNSISSINFPLNC